MQAKDIIEKACKDADGDLSRVRIRMICEKFSHECLDYRFEYKPEIDSVLIQDPSTNVYYRYPVKIFESRLNNNTAKIVIMPKKNPKFTFSKYFEENDLTSFDNINVIISSVKYSLTPEIPSMFDIKYRKGSRCTVYLKEVGNTEKKLLNLKEIEELIRKGEAFLEIKK